MRKLWGKFPAKRQRLFAQTFYVRSKSVDGVTFILLNQILELKANLMQHIFVLLHHLQAERN